MYAPNSLICLCNYFNQVLIRDVNDEPSTPRSVKINVYNYGKVVNGVIGTVEPNDVDTVGEYQCSLGSQQYFSIISQ